MKDTAKLDSDPNIGRFVLEKYRIEAPPLGAGGMGTVYKAKHVELNNYVAVKVLQHEWTHNQQVVARFIREARLASDLSHPRIVKVFDAGVFEDGSHYIVMELLDGMDLEDKIAQYGWIHDLDEALVFALQIADPLAVAHSARDERGRPAAIIHRDLKPENIFIERGNRLKLLDFGIAKLTSSEEDVQLTGAGSRMGTPLYMSPEQFLDSGQVDARSDIFSFGVILYRMLTGRLPFLGASPTAIALAHHQQPPVDPRVHRPEIPEGWSRAILRAMSVRVEDRQRSVRELAGELIAGYPGGEQIARRLVPDLLSIADPEDLTVKQREGATVSTSYHTAGATLTQPPVGGTRARSWLLPALLGAGVLGISVAVVVVTRGGNAGERGGAAEPDPPAAAPAADAAPRTVAAEPPDAASALAWVSVRIVTDPPGAAVRVDGDELGTAPVSFTGRVGQRITVQAHRENYTARPVDFELRADTPRLEIALRPIERVPRKRVRRKHRASKASSRQPPKQEAPKPPKKRATKAGVFR